MHSYRSILLSTVLGVTLTGLAVSAHAQVNVGVTVSQTGPAAALGIPQKNSVPMLPKEVAGQKIEYIVLDDATDPTKAVANARKMIAENKIDYLIGSSGTTATMALVDIAGVPEEPIK